MEPIHVLGAGSVGLLMAASLRVAFPSYPVKLLLREHHRVRPGQERPTVLVNLIQNRRLRTVNVPSQIISPNFVPNRKFRNVLLATKAYQAVPALESIRHCLQLTPNAGDNPPTSNNDASTSLLTKGTQVVLLCNGAMGVRDDILKHFPELPPNNLHTALTTHGAYRELVTSDAATSESSSHYYESANEASDSIMMDVVHAGLGRLDFPPSLAAWTPLFDRAGLQAHTLTHSEMQRQLWCKLAANCLINPLTALHQCTNGQVMHLDEWNDLLQAVPAEVANVAALVLQQEDEAETADDKRLRDFCEYVVTSTADNRSSMLQDVRAGRRTEIDYLNGYIVRLGEEKGVAVPANRDLYDRILSLDA